MSSSGLVFAGIASIALVFTGISSAYIVDEGRVAVITHMGQAVRQEPPAGLQWKMPFVQGVSEFDVRERAMTGTFSATTSNQLSSIISWSMNWRPDPARIMEIYVDYGSPEDFATNTILPRLNQALKDAVGQHSAIDLAIERNVVADTMYNTAQANLEGLPVIITSIQLDDYTLPDRYWNAVIAREEQREVTERQRLYLQQQELEVQQTVQTAEAEADATRARAEAQAFETRTLAEAEAESVRLLAEAEADGIAVVQSAIAGNPLFIQYNIAQRWNGQLPTQMIPGTAVPFINIGD